jgi:hypothetical protein
MARAEHWGNLLKETIPTTSIGLLHHTDVIIVIPGPFFSPNMRTTINFQAKQKKINKMDHSWQEKKKNDERTRDASMNRVKCDF